MKLVDSIASLFRKSSRTRWDMIDEMKADPTYNIQNRTQVGQPKWRMRNYRAWTEEGYKANVICRKAIDLVARHCAAVKLDVFVGDKEASADHPLSKLLKKPNPTQSGKDFTRNAVAFYLMAGNSYLTAEGTGDSTLAMPTTIAEIYAIRPDLTAPIPGAFGVAQYVFKNNGQEKYWNVNPVTGEAAIRHWKSFNPIDTDVGLSIMESAAMSIDQHNAASEWNKNVLSNATVPSGAFKYGDGRGGIMPPQQREALRKEIDASMSGPLNARRPMLLDGALTWESMSMTPLEMDFIESKNLTTREICVAFGTPGQLMNIPGDSTYSNYETARLAFYEETVLPTLNELLDHLNAWLCPSFGDNVTIRYDEDSISALAPRRKEKWDSVEKCTFITINEKRTATGYEPLTEPEADSVWMASGLIPMQSADGGEDKLPPEGTPEDNPDAPLDAGKPASDANTAPVTDVQSSAMNGAQVAALQGIIQSVADKELPAATAQAMIQSAFPSISAAAVQEMLKPLASFEAAKKPDTVPPAGLIGVKPPVVVPEKPPAVKP